MKHIYLAVIVLALALLACGGQADLAGYDTQKQSYVCSPGQRLGIAEYNGAPVCWR